MNLMKILIWLILFSQKKYINEEEWIIDKPIITKNNITKKDDGVLIYVTNFNKEKINNLFSNISTLNLLELFDLKKIMKNWDIPQMNCYPFT